MNIQIFNLSFLNNIATILTILLFAYTVLKYFYNTVFNKYEKEISHYSKSKKLIDLISNSIHLNSNLKIFWKDEKIDNTNIVITEYTLWNSGKKELRTDDIAKLMIKSNSENTKFLDVIVSYESDNTNEFSIVETHSNFITMNFNYLNPNEFAKIRIWHTGTCKQLEFILKLKGNHCIRNVSEEYKSKYVDEKNIIKLYFISLGIAFATKALIGNLKDYYPQFVEISIPIIGLILIGYWIWLYYLLFRNGFLEIKARVPRKLRKDYNSDDLS